MASESHPESTQVVAAVVSAAMWELLDSMMLLCTRLRDPSAPLSQDVYDRLGLLIPSMFGAAEGLCHAAEKLLLASNPSAAHGDGALSVFGELALALVETRRLVKLLLISLKPQLKEHAEAVALIDRLLAESK